MMTNFSKFKEVALYCEETFGVEINLEEEYFNCPECGEPIYYIDWYNLKDYWHCPICGIDYNTGEYYDEFEEE